VRQRREMDRRTTLNQRVRFGEKSSPLLLVLEGISRNHLSSPSTPPPLPNPPLSKKVISILQTRGDVRFCQVLRRDAIGRPWLAYRFVCRAVYQPSR
jgi:hypothetical protein